MDNAKYNLADSRQAGNDAGETVRIANAYIYHRHDGYEQRNDTCLAICHRLRTHYRTLRVASV